VENDSICFIINKVGLTCQQTSKLKPTIIHGESRMGMTKQRPFASRQRHLLDEKDGWIK
jgi:hypothetical protein